MRARQMSDARRRKHYGAVSCGCGDPLTDEDINAKLTGPQRRRYHKKHNHKLAVMRRERAAKRQETKP